MSGFPPHPFLESSLQRMNLIIPQNKPALSTQTLNPKRNNPDYNAKNWNVFLRMRKSLGRSVPSLSLPLLQTYAKGGCFTAKTLLAAFERELLLAKNTTTDQNSDLFLFLANSLVTPPAAPSYSPPSYDNCRALPFMPSKMPSK